MIMHQVNFSAQKPCNNQQVIFKIPYLVSFILVHILHAYKHHCCILVPQVSTPLVLCAPFLYLVVPRAGVALSNKMFPLATKIPVSGALVPIACGFKNHNFQTQKLHKRTEKFTRLSVKYRKLVVSSIPLYFMGLREHFFLKAHSSVS